MEILNNIWLAISTPNIELVNISTIPVFFIEAALTMYLFLSIMGLFSTKKQRIVYILITSSI